MSIWERIQDLYERIPGHLIRYTLFTDVRTHFIEDSNIANLCLNSNVY